MNPLLRIALITSTAVFATACGHSHSEHGRHATHTKHAKHHYKPGDGAIDLQGDEVVIRAGGTTEDARVATDGGLSIGGRPVEISAEGRAALTQYDADAVAIQEHAVALGKAGARFGWTTVKEIMHGIFEGNTDEAEKHAEDGAKELASSVADLCGRLGSIYASQQTAASAVPEFAPYAVISKRQVDECFSESKDHDDRHHDDADDKDGDDGDDNDNDSDSDDSSGDAVKPKPVKSLSHST